MNNNIFENAKFGEIFVTKDGTKHSFCSFTKSGFDTCARLYREGWGIVIFYLDGQPHSGGEFGNGIDSTIVGRLYEPIDERKLSEFAWEHVDSMDIPCRYEETALESFKAGYRKAKEE